ncbi:sarcoplasmic reticulum histidine-rich calcium-binding protein isoform X1 [Hydra vulgaris]|uniref:sarcoplasmic reticulum histidine-rich calcium-binding protein isoform X1 n=1 Tax=Hydra vulgaris TaxID=6087 RepID=UPI0006411087|nr:sarcoplasmic reticulum histidine-rich calcium-binding protein-like [Hydra vulgaris]
MATKEQMVKQAMYSSKKFLQITLILLINVKYSFSMTLYGERKKDDWMLRKGGLDATKSILVARDMEPKTLKYNKTEFETFLKNFTENENLIANEISKFSENNMLINFKELRDKKWKIQKRCFCYGNSLMHHICEAHNKMHDFGHHAHDVMDHFGDRAHETMHEFGHHAHELKDNFGHDAHERLREFGHEAHNTKDHFGHHAHELKENFGHDAHEKLREFGHDAHNTKDHFGCDQHEMLNMWHQCGCVKKSKISKTLKHFMVPKKSFINNFCRDGRCNNNYDKTINYDKIPFEAYNRDNYFNPNQDENLNEQQNSDNIFDDRRLENAAFGHDSTDKPGEISREHQDNFEENKHGNFDQYERENYNRHRNERKDDFEHPQQYDERKKQYEDDEIDHYNDLSENKNKDYIGNEDHRSSFANDDSDHVEKDPYATIGNNENEENPLKSEDSENEKEQDNSFGENQHKNKANFGENSHNRRKHFGEREHGNKQRFGESQHANKERFGEEEHYNREHFGEEEHNSRAHFGKKEHKKKERFGESENEFKNHFGEKAHEKQNNFGEQEHKYKEEFGKTAHENQAHFGREAHSSKEHFGEEEHENKENFGREAHMSREHFGENQHEKMKHFGDKAHKNLENFYIKSKEQHKNKEHFGEKEHDNKKHFGEEAHKTMGMFGKSAHEKMKNFGLQAHKNLEMFGVKDFQSFLNTRNIVVKSINKNKNRKKKNCVRSKFNTRTYHDEPCYDDGDDDEEDNDNDDDENEEYENRNDEHKSSSLKDHEYNAKERMEHFGEHAHEHKDEFGIEQHKTLANFEHISRDHREEEAKKQREHFGEQQHEKKKHFGEGDPEYHSRCAHDKLRNFGKFAHHYGCGINFAQYRSKIENAVKQKTNQQKPYYRKYKPKLWPEYPQVFKNEKSQTSKNKTNSNKKISIGIKINKPNTSENNFISLLKQNNCDFCENGALCVTEPDPIKFTCYCPYNYEGNRCEIYSPQKKACSQNTCYNGGRCEERPNKKEKFHCYCLSGWHGQQCTEKDIMDWSKW